MSASASTGAIITFYSYKGGVGRSMAVANTAVQLARKGNHVLMVDWDLEAPGLMNYFISEEAQSKANVSYTYAEDASGLLGLLMEEYRLGIDEDLSIRWKRRIIELSVPSSPADYSSPYPPTPGKLDLIPSGYGSEGYSPNLADFSWRVFFDDHSGAYYLESLRSEWSKNYEFILVDSRTGLTDSGGICTIQMPDYLVLVFTANDQSLSGGLKVVSAVQEARKVFAFERAPLAVVPLLTRWDGESEVDLAEIWINRLGHEVEPLTSIWLPKDFSPRQFLEKTRIPHVPRFSFGEPLPVLTHSLTDPNLPGLAYENLAQLLHSRLANAGQLIDPTYMQPHFTSASPVEDYASVLPLLSGEVDLNREIARLSRSKNSEELARLLMRSSSILRMWGRFSEAEPLARRLLALSEATNKPESLKVAAAVSNLALLMQETNRLSEAELLMQRALAINEANYGLNHPSVAICLKNLAALLQATNRLAEAESLMRRALAIDEANFGPDHPNVAIDLNNMAQILKSTNRLAEAEPLMRRALTIDESSFGLSHPNVATGLNNLAQLLQETNRLAEAEPLYRRALAIDEASYGPDHPMVAIRLNNLALVLQATNRMAEAEPLMRRALAIDEAGYGPDHPDVAIRLNNLAQLLKSTDRLAEAEPLMRRAVEILFKFTAETGHQHPNLTVGSENYISLLTDIGYTEGEARAIINELAKKYGVTLNPTHLRPAT